MNHKTRLLIICTFSILGIVASFMPWLYFPKTDSTLPGYVGDGVLTAFVFFVCLFMAGSGIFNNSFGIKRLIFCFLIGVVVWILAVYKLQKIEFDIIHFKADNPLLGAAVAGVQAGSGLILLLISAIGLTIISGIWMAFIILKREKKESISSFNENQNNRTFLLVFGVLAILTSGIYFLPELLNKKQSIESIRPLVSRDIEEMGKALASKDLQKFADFNHPTMQLSIGGREELIKLLQSTLDGFEKSGAAITGITLKEINTMAQDGKNIQLILRQNVVFNQGLTQSTEVQKVLAVSEDNGNHWQFINIGNKTKTEIEKIFPGLNKKLIF